MDINIKLLLLCAMHYSSVPQILSILIQKSIRTKLNTKRNSAIKIIEIDFQQLYLSTSSNLKKVDFLLAKEFHPELLELWV